MKRHISLLFVVVLLLALWGSSSAANVECPCAAAKTLPCACAVEAEAVDTLKIAPEYKAGGAVTTSTTLSPAKVVSDTTSTPSSVTPVTTGTTTTTTTTSPKNIYVVNKAIPAVPKPVVAAPTTTTAAAAAKPTAAQQKATMATAALLDKKTGKVQSPSSSTTKATTTTTSSASSSSSAVGSIPDVKETNPTAKQAEAIATTATSDVKSISTSIASIKKDLIAHRQREAVRAVKEKIAHLEKKLLEGQKNSLSATTKVTKVGADVSTVANDVSSIKAKLAVVRTKNLADDVAQSRKEAAAAAKEIELKAALKTERLKLKRLEKRLWRDETRRSKLIGSVTVVKSKADKALARQRKRAQLRRKRFIAQAKAQRAKRRLLREKSTKSAAGKESLRKLRRRIRRRQHRESHQKKELRIKYNVKEHNHKLTVKEVHHKSSLRHKEALVKKTTAHKLAAQRKVNEHLIKIYQKDMDAVRKQLHAAKKNLYKTMSETKVKHLKRRHAWLLARRRKLRAETTRQHKMLMKAKHAAAVARVTLGTKLAKAQAIIMQEAVTKRKRFHYMKLEMRRKTKAHNQREKRRQLKEKNTKKRRHLHWLARQAKHRAHLQEVATKHAKTRQLHLAKLQAARAHSEKKQKHFWASEKLQKKKEWHNKWVALKNRGHKLRASQIKALKLKLKAQHMKMASRLMQSKARARAKRYAALAKTAHARATHAVAFLMEKVVKKTARKRLALKQKQAKLEARLRVINAHHVAAMLKEGRVKAMRASLRAAHKMRTILLASQRHIKHMLAKGRKAMTKHHLRVLRAKGLLRLRKARVAMRNKLAKMRAKQKQKQKAWAAKMIKKNLALEKRGKQRIRHAHKEASSKKLLVKKAKSEANLKYKVHTLAAKTHLLASKRRAKALARAAAIRASKNSNVLSLHKKYVKLQKRAKRESTRKAKLLSRKRKRMERFKKYHKHHEKQSKLHVIVLEGKFKAKKRTLAKKRAALLAKAAKMSRAHRAHIKAALKLKFQRALRRIKRARHKEKHSKEKAHKVYKAKKSLWARQRALWIKLRKSRRHAFMTILKARRAMFKKASSRTYKKCQHMNAEINKQVHAFDAKHCKKTKGPAVIRCHWQLLVFKNKLLAQRASICLDVNPTGCKSSKTWFAKRIADIHAGCIRLKGAARTQCHKKVTNYQLRAFRTVAKLCNKEKCAHAKKQFASRHHHHSNCSKSKSKTCTKELAAVHLACHGAHATGCIGAKLVYKARVAAAKHTCKVTLHVKQKQACLRKLPFKRRALHKKVKKACANKCQNAKHYRKHRAKTFLASCQHQTGSLRTSCFLQYKKLSLVWLQREKRICREHGPCGRAHHAYHHAISASLAKCLRTTHGFKQSLCYKNLHHKFLRLYKRVQKTCFLFSPAQLLKRKVAAEKAIKKKAMDKLKASKAKAARIAWAKAHVKLTQRQKCALAHKNYKTKVTGGAAHCKKVVDSRKKTKCYHHLAVHVHTWYKAVRTNCPCQHAKHSYKVKVATYTKYCTTQKGAANVSCLASLKTFRKVWYRTMRVTCKTWRKHISHCGKATKLYKHTYAKAVKACNKVAAGHKRNLCLFKVHQKNHHWKKAMKTACAQNACGVARRALRRNVKKSARHCARQTSTSKRHLCFVKYGLLRKTWRQYAATKCATPTTCQKAYKRFKKLVRVADHKCGRLTGHARATCSKKVNAHRRKWFLHVKSACHSHKSWACKHRTYAFHTKIRHAQQACHKITNGPKRLKCLSLVIKVRAKKWKQHYKVTFTCSHASCAVATATYSKKLAAFSKMCKARSGHAAIVSCTSSMKHHAKHWYVPVRSACAAHARLIAKMKRLAAKKRAALRAKKRKKALGHEARLKSRVVSKNKQCSSHKVAFYKKVRKYHRRCKLLGAKNKCTRVSAGSVYKCLQAKKKYHKLVAASITRCTKKGSNNKACFAALKTHRHTWYNAVKTVCEHAATASCKKSKLAYAKKVKVAMTSCSKKHGAARSSCVASLMKKRHGWFRAVKTQCKRTKVHTKLVCKPKAGSRLAQSVCNKNLQRLKKTWYKSVTKWCKGSTLGHCVTAKKTMHDKVSKMWTTCAAKSTRVAKKHCYQSLRIKKSTWKLAVLKQCNQKCHHATSLFHKRVARQKIICRWSHPKHRKACHARLVKQRKVWKALSTLACAKHRNKALANQRKHAKAVLRSINLSRKVHAAKHKCLVSKKAYFHRVRKAGLICAKKASHAHRVACYKKLHAHRRVWYHTVKKVCKHVKTAKKGHCSAARKVYGAKVKHALAKCKGKTSCIRSLKQQRIRWYQRVKKACHV